jgi:alpha-amylase
VGLLRSPPLLFLPFLLLSCASAHHSTNGSDSRPPPEETAIKEEGREDDTCQPIPPLTETRWYHDAIGYEIFVRSFYDSDGDGIGDLQGLREKLDYINDGDPEGGNDLGVTLLWLMPTFPSPSYHGYDVTDYRGVNPDYGSLEELELLVDEGKKRGVKIILDLVLNHSSRLHPWFLDSTVEASSKREWYIWSSEFLDWKRPFGGEAGTWHKAAENYYYAVFWSGMPDLNYTSKEVRSEMTDVGRFWLEEIGIAGYRLDAVRYLVETGPDGLQDTPATMAWWEEFASAMHAVDPDALLLGEAWASNSVAAGYHVGGNGLDLTFDFDLMEAIVTGMLAEEPADIENVLCRFAGQFPPGAGDATFLTNHDLVRLASRVKSNEELMRLGAMLLFTLPGMPTIYYGQEIGMSNGPLLTDEHKRLPMQWDDTPNAGFSTGKPWLPVNGDNDRINVGSQLADGNSLLSLYRQLIALRQANSALRSGGFQPLKAFGKTTYDVWGFSRFDGTSSLAIFVNFSGSPALDARLTLPHGTYKSATRLFPDSLPATIQGDSLSVGDVPAYSLVVVKL